MADTTTTQLPALPSLPALPNAEANEDAVKKANTTMWLVGVVGIVVVAIAVFIFLKMKRRTK